MQVLSGSRSQLIIALGFFSIAGILFLAGIYMIGLFEGQSAAPVREPEPVGGHAAVVAAAAPISRGQQVTPELVRTVLLAGARPPNAFAETQEVIGRVAVVDIHPNQIVVAETVSADPAAAGLAALIPENMRALGVRVSDEIAVGNYVRPGDWVDLHVVLPGRLIQNEKVEFGGDRAEASEARLVLQNVLILTVGAAMELSPRPADGKQPANRPGDLRDITLAVTPEQASQLALMRSLASYSLTLRRIGDHEITETKPVTLSGLRGEDTGKPLDVTLSSGPNQRVVEILRGRNLEMVPAGWPRECCR